jgi:hypothetical protein
VADADPPYPNHYDERVAHVAVHRKPEPPRTLSQWREFEAWCWYLGDERWLPAAEDFRISPPVEAGGLGWIPLAEDHPFKGCEFCWRCLAEASGYAPGLVPHRSGAHGICFQADGTPDTEDPDEDGCETVTISTGAGHVVAEVRVCDPSRPALAGSEEFRQWWQAGASIVAEGNDYRNTWPPSWTDEDAGRDTGTFFYDGPVA